MAKSIPEELAPNDSVKVLEEVAVQDLTEEVQEIFYDQDLQPGLEHVKQVDVQAPEVADPTPQVEDQVSDAEQVANPQRIRVADGGILTARSSRKP